ncbi:hypothetical protein [Streptacidiphilus sp. MAP12-20]|uniref:hypothetical protein n=1 Tax=Streptacidiphilus sp. MAP12-20 TaxID=3156299 RepID=UPI00351197BD
MTTQRTARQRARLRAGLLAGGVALALTTLPVFAGRGSGSGASAAEAVGAQPVTAQGGIPGENGQPWDGQTHLIGDGSTSYTGPQPEQPTPTKLKPGERPPQFVVFSWDGALENDQKLFSHYLQLSEQYHAQMTFFLTGMYLLPSSKRYLYHPPKHGVGTAAISFATDQHIRWTLQQLSQAWQNGDEIGTHFNGHFCGAGGGGDWSTKEWLSETQQAYSFVENWKTNTGFTDIPALPFDYSKELVGGRAPCLEGQKTLVPAEKQLGWRYDASSPGDFQAWPRKVDGIWNFPLQEMPYPGHDFQVLSMDFNFLANQSGGNPSGDPAKYAQWEQSTVDGYMNGFNRAYYGSRAPLFIGNHFENWNGGIYMQAMDQVIKNTCSKPDVRCVSFKEMADWLDVQSPAVLAKLRGLDPSESPDWSTFIRGSDSGSGSGSDGSSGNPKDSSGTGSGSGSGDSQRNGKGQGKGSGGNGGGQGGNGN